MRIIDLGLVEYDAAMETQRQVHEEVRAGAPSALILCRHTPVITLGRNTLLEDLLIPEEELAKAGIKIARADRGGRITYHGPGQQVIYAVCDLKKHGCDLHRFLRSLEELVLQLLSELDIRGQRREGKTGVWIGERKIASVGIGVRGWVTYHGAAINLKKDDCGAFRFIRPCGMDITMTSAEDVLGRQLSADAVAGIMKRRIGDDRCYPA